MGVKTEQAEHGHGRQVLHEHPAVRWLASRQRFGVKPGLERTRRVLERLGRPQDGLRFYHVAGTNGKGSVCAYLTALLGRCGRVGTFTSPAFDGFRGRFMVDGEPIDDDAFIGLAQQVQAVCQGPEDAADPLTEFEALTVMALLYFRERRVEHVAWETGLGGRYDSTNVVQPVVTAITNVGYDHMDVLGNTLAEIAYQKAGILKPGIPVITAARDSAYLVIERVAREVAAPVWRHQVQFQHVREAWQGAVQRMHYRGPTRDLYGLSIPLLGAHQCANAAVALAMVEAAAQAGHCRVLPDDEVRQALLATVWPGRFEVFASPLGHPVVFDGAHNADGASQLRAALSELGRLCAPPVERWTMVIGVLQDKEIYPMLDAVVPLAAEVIATSPANGRALPADELATRIRRRWPEIPVTAVPHVKEAWQAAMARERPVCCWGSLYTVDEARNAMKQEEIEFQKWGR